MAWTAMGNKDEVRYIAAGRYVRARRKELQLTIEDLANQMNQYGALTSRSALQRLEYGEGWQRHALNPVFMTALAKALKIQESDVLKQIITLPADEQRQRIISMINRLTPDALKPIENLIALLATQDGQQKD